MMSIIVIIVKQRVHHLLTDGIKFAEILQFKLTSVGGVAVNLITAQNNVQFSSLVLN